MKHVIITSADAVHGEFMSTHWIQSLKANVSLQHIEIVALDYGLTAKQKYRLNEYTVEIFPCVRDGHIVNTRYRDMISFLKQKNYDQVLSIDGGDIVFQGDISNLFDEDTNAIRIVEETVKGPFAFMGLQALRETDREKISTFLSDKHVLNAGFILASQQNFIEMCKQILDLVGVNHLFGSAQAALSYILHKSEYKLLNSKYNFMLNGNCGPYTIKDGIFYTGSGDKILVAHNVGNKNYYRIIRNFGFGATCNQKRFIRYCLLRTFFRLSTYLR